jgi:hypothetical protein
MNTFGTEGDTDAFMIAYANFVQRIVRGYEL